MRAYLVFILYRIILDLINGDFIWSKINLIYCRVTHTWISLLFINSEDKLQVTKP